MTALRNAGACNPVVLALERAGGVDDDIRQDSAERRGQVSVDIDRVSLDQIGSAEPGSECLRFCLRPSANQQTDLRIRRKRPGDIAAEISVAADDEDARYHEGFATMR